MNEEFNKNEFNNNDINSNDMNNYDMSHYDMSNNDRNSNQNNYYDDHSNYTSQTNQGVIDADVVMADQVTKPKKKHKLIKSLTKTVAAAMVFGLVAGASFQGYNTLVSKNQDSNSSVTQSTSETDADTESTTNGDSSNAVTGETTNDAVAVKTSNQETTSDVSTVVANVMPSIVAINSVVNQVSSDMFGRQYSEEVEGSGSGIIIGQNDTEILIATNNHVVEGATSVEIVFTDETTAQATIKGTAASSDLAVVAVNVEDLEDSTLDSIKIATLGDSETTKLGEMAIAIGNALGYGQSVTVGYISALNREVTIDNTSLSLIQTDAAINPGNSGGALLNTKGEVIGINSVKYVDSSVESIGYAIPISDAIPIINELMNRTVLEETETAYLGIAGKDVTEAYSEGFGMPVGVYVASVAEDSAAEKAGIQVGDIIVSINDINVETMADLQDVLSYTKAGSTGTIIVKSLKDGEYVENTLSITYGTKPASSN